MKSVLVIEDDEDTLSAIVALLEIERIPAIGVRSCAEAIDHFDAGGRPSVIVLDLVMPGMSGFEFLKGRRSAPALAQVPVIVITGIRVTLEDFGDMNVAAVLRKPFDPSQIIEEVLRHCRDATPYDSGATP